MSHFVYCFADYDECRYAECRYAECRHAECRGAISSPPVTAVVARLKPPWASTQNLTKLIRIKYLQLCL